jgi:hypothetical protein
VVLKIVGAVDLPGHLEPTDPFYWKREPIALGAASLVRTVRTGALLGG